MGNLVDVPSALATIWQTPSVRRVGVLVRNVPQGEGRATHAHLSKQLHTNIYKPFGSLFIFSCLALGAGFFVCLFVAEQNIFGIEK